MADRATEFRRWLTKRGYRPRTVDKTECDLRSYLQNQSIVRGRLTLARWRDYARAYEFYREFAKETGFRVQAPPLDEKWKPKPQPRMLKKKRQKPALSIDESEWKKLRKAVAYDETPEARVIEVMLATGLRVGDVLRVPPDTLAQALKRTDGLFSIELKGGKVIHYPIGGAESEWKHLLSAIDLMLSDPFGSPGRTATHVAEFVSEQKDPEDRAAYFRVRDRFTELCEAVGLTGRTNLHRIRRTVGVRLLDRGVPLYDVQRVLGHADSRTTQGYTDEWSAGRMSDALKKNRD